MTVEKRTIQYVGFSISRNKLLIQLFTFLSIHLISFCPDSFPTTPISSSNTSLPRVLLTFSTLKSLISLFAASSKFSSLLATLVCLFSFGGFSPSNTPGRPRLKDVILHVF